MVFVLTSAGWSLVGEARGFRVATTEKAFVLVVAEKGFVLVEAALVYGAASEGLTASLTVVGHDDGVELPEDCVPVEFFASEIGHEFIEVPVAVYFVLLSGLSLGVNKQIRLFTRLPSELVFSE